MVSLVRALVAVLLLAVPFLVIANAPKLFDLAGSVPAAGPTQQAFATPFRLADPTATAKPRLVPLDAEPPPTLQPVATPTIALKPTPTGERIVVNNTGGIGAVLRAEPVSGTPIMSLREQTELTVLERRSVPGAGEWLRVRTADGKEGWVFGLVARPSAPARP